MHKLYIRTMVLGPISTNTYICNVIEVSDSTGEENRADGGCFIVDPAANAPAIIEALGDMKPSAILLTHGHFDHLMAVNDLRAEYPGIKVYAHPDDTEVMLHPGRFIVRKEFTNQAVSDFSPIRDGEILTIGGLDIEIISTPGHTKGGVCYYVASNKVMFSGDTLFKDSYGRTDFESGDFEELKDSIVNKLFTRFRTEGHVDILPGHMDPTTSEYEMESNPILG